MSRTFPLLRRCVSSLSLLFASVLVAVSAHAAPGTLNFLPAYSHLTGSDPGARFGQTMAFDGQELVLFGGAAPAAGTYNADTWIWSGTAWTQVTGLTPGTNAPTARLGASIAYDQKNGKVVLFGGYDGTTFLADTWTWSASTKVWTKVATTGVSGRQYASMVYDPNSNAGAGAVILFGGNNAGSSLGDMYAWNGTAWSTLSPASVPPGRTGAAMVYDSVRNNVVLFGGESGNSILVQSASVISGTTTLGDTWLWNGTNWTSAGTLTPSPSARWLSASAFNIATGQLVVTDGIDSGNTPLSDTWLWNGTGWVLDTAAAGPSSTRLASMAYDPLTSQAVMFGNQSATDNGTYLMQPVNMGSVNVGVTGVSVGTSTLTFGASANSVSFGTGGSGGTPASVLTLGAAGQDFTLGSTTCSSATALTATSTCTVTVNFSPVYPGARNGAVQLLDGSNNVVATVPVYGVGNGPQVVFNPGKASVLGGGFSGANGVVIDGSGTAYIADSNNMAVKKIPAGCASAACVTSVGSFSQVTNQIATDGSGNLYVTDTNQSVYKLAPTCTSTSCMTILGGGFHRPTGIAVDGSGNIYVADNLNNAVKVMPNSCASISCVTTLGGGFSRPNGLALDSAGNVYVADTSNNAIKEIPAGCTSSTCVTTLPGTGTAYVGVAVDPGGNVYATSLGASVTEIPAGCASSACVTSLIGGFTSAQVVALDATGNLYAIEGSTATLNKFDRVTGPSLTFPTTTLAGTTDTTDGPKTVNLSNIGNMALSFPPPAVGPQNPSITADYSLTGTCPVVLSGGTAATLAAAASCAAQVTFTPQAADVGTISGSLVFTDTNLNAASTTQTVSLSGTSALAPTVASISPASGTSLGGTSVGITGANFTGATAVAFGGTAATTFTVNDGSSITATSPAGTGTVDVTVITPAATSATSAADQFTYIAYPTVTSVSPAAGPTTGGTAVTITGTNFTGATAVSFGGTPAASFTFNSATSITATSPAGTGTVHVTVTTPSGTTTTSAADQFTYAAAPTLTGINPSAGPLAGGTAVTATGANFVSGSTTVSIGGTTIPAGSVTFNSANSVTFTTPLHAIGAVNVSVSTPGGTTANATYVYQGTPGITVQNVTAPMTSVVTLSATVTFVAGTTPTGAFSFTISGNATPIPATCTAATSTTETCTASYSLGTTAPGPYTITGAITADTNYTAASNTGTLTVTSLPTYTVTTLADDATGNALNCVSGALGLGGGNGNCSLRDAIAAANSFSFAAGSAGSTITFLSTLANSTTPGTINITTGGTLAITQPVTIIGLGANALSLSGNNSAQILTVGANSSISALRFFAGKSSTVGGAINLTGGTLTLNNDYFLSNSGGGGGAVSTGAAAGLLTVTNSTFASNSATSKAAAVYTAAGSGGLSVANSTFASNTSASGASAVSFAGASGKVINSTFSTNNSTDATATSEGALSAHSALQVSNSIFSGNTTSGAIGGGVTAIGGSVVTASNNDYYNNTANSVAANCVGCTDTNSVTGDPKLSTLGNFGGTVLTMLPQPGSAAICAASLALSTSTNDERGVAHSAAYCTTAGNELDAGAVQTRYALTFGTLASQLSSGTALVPNPTVTVQENGIPVSGASVSLVLSSGSTLSGTTSASSAATGIATFNNLILPAGLTNNTLNASLTVGTSATVAQATVSSSTFSSLAVGPATLTGITVGVPYTVVFTTSNGMGPYSYAITSGTQPTGLSLTPGSGAGAGTLSGTPTAGGTFNFTVTATDANGKTAFQAYTVTVAPPTIVVTPTSLPTLTYNTLLSPNVTFSASGGTSTYTYIVSAGALPAGLSLSTAGVLSGTPTAAGPYNFTVKATDSSTGTGSPYFGTVTLTGTVQKAVATVNLASLTQTYTGSTLTATATTVPAGLTVNFSYTQGSPAVPTTPINAGTYTVTGTINDPNYQGTASATFTINKATAVVNLGSLTQTYTGSTLTATATTSSPSGLTVTFAYTQGSPAVPATPINAGTYTVTGTISDPNYQGTASATFTINKSTQTVTLGNLSPTYTGGTLSATATTSPVAGLTVNFAYTQGSPAVPATPINAGTYTVTGTINDPNYQGTASATFTINKAVAPITLSNLTPTYTGLPIAAIAKTVPAGLTVTLTYNGSSTAPTLAGSYAVAATVVDANYMGSNTGTLIIGKATLTITAPTLTKVYGAAIPTLTGTYSGNVNNETFSVSVTTTATAASPVVVGGYPITPTVTGATLANYIVVPVQGKLTITPATLTITAPNVTKPYGAVIPSLAGTYTGAVNGDTFTVTGSTPANSGSPVVAGGYPITPSVTGTNLSSYTVVSVPGVLTITQVTLTITAPTLSKVYGAPLPPLTGTYTGNVGNDTFTVTGTTSATAASPVVAGGYVITPSVSGPNLSSYNLVTVPGVLTITPATLTITAPTLNKAYGAPLPSLNGTYAGNVNGDTFTVTGSTTATAASPVLPGGYTITPSVTGANLSNYTLVSVPGILNITPVTLTITAPTFSKAYGAPLPSLNGTYSGNVNGDTFTISGVTDATAASPVVAGGYPITPVAVGANLSSYNIVAVPGVITITPVTLTVTAPTLSKTYGANLPSLNGTYTGAVNGDTFVVNGTTTATATSPVVAGGYPITPSVAGPNLSSYTVVKVPGVLTVTPAALTIVAPNLTKGYGAAVPALDGTYSGNVAGDTFTVTGTTTATASSPVVAGGYVITPAVTGANLSNYTVVKVTGVLTIAPANLTVTVAPASKVYQTPNPVLTGTVTGVLPGDGITASYSTAATTASPVGAYAIIATLNDPNGKLGNYTVTNTPSTLTITPITPVIAFTAIPAAVLLGDSVTLSATLSSTAGVPTGKVNFLDGAVLIASATLNTSGVATVSLTTLSAGSHTITAVYAGDTNFVTVTSASATVLVQDFTLNIANGTLPAQSAPLGGTATFSFAVTPSAATFALPVSFTVSGLPTGATATFTPSTIASGSSATNVILSVKLPASLAEVRPDGAIPFNGLAPLSLALLSLPFIAWKRRKGVSATKLLGMFLLLFAGTVGALTVTGCGPAANMGTQTTARSYTLTITATEGALSRTTTTTLNVQ